MAPLSLLYISKAYTSKLFYAKKRLTQNNSNQPLYDIKNKFSFSLRKYQEHENLIFQVY